MNNIKQNLTCIGCPLGCQIEVKLEDGRVISVAGNTCPKGKKYAEKEVTNPMRTVTSSVPVEGSLSFVTQVSVKTEDEIPKDKIFDCIEALKSIKMQAPVKIGDIVLENVADTGVNVIATKNV